jgi:preprotein translocase subunit SecE
MARDRQRAKQRRRRQQSGGPAARSASRTAKKARDVGLDDATIDDAGLGGSTPTPDPLDHASADVDQAKLAEAGATPPSVGDADEGATAPSVGDADDAYDGAYDDFDDVERAPDEAEEDLLPSAPADHDAVEHAPRRSRGRVLTFLRHSVDELRRVQWPDRRQVGQATAVVLGFVVLAGGYLGLLDALWKPIIDAIL